MRPGRVGGVTHSDVADMVAKERELSDRTGMVRPCLRQHPITSLGSA